MYVTCFYFVPSVKFTQSQSSPPQGYFLIPVNSLCISARLTGLTLTFMFGWLGCLSRIVFVFTVRHSQFDLGHFFEGS